jgi:hypothetical protein
MPQDSVDLLATAKVREKRYRYALPLTVFDVGA